MSLIGGIGGTSLALAIFAGAGGFGCICNVVGTHRCGGDEDLPSLREPDPPESDGGSDPDANDSGK